MARPRKLRNPVVVPLVLERKLYEVAFSPRGKSV